MKRTLFIILAVVAVVITVVGIVPALLNGAGGRAAIVQPPAFGRGGGGAPDTGSAPSVSTNYAQVAPELAPAAPAPVADGSVANSKDAYYAADGSVRGQERKVIETVDLSLVVKDPASRMQEIGALAKELGGYVVESHTYQASPNDNRIVNANIRIRIPNPKLDEALGKIKTGAADVQYENRTGQDVTDQYIDLQSRLKVKQAAEQKLLEILDKATRTEDVLAVYMQLQQIQSEIEVLKGQIKYLDESVALSSVYVELIAEDSLPPLQVGGWRLGPTALNALQDLGAFVQSFARLLIQLVLLVIPALLLIGLTFYGAFLGGRAVYRRFRKARPGAQEVQG